MGDPLLRRGRTSRADGAVLHDDEAAGRVGPRVHPDAPVHAAAEGQHGRRGWRRAPTATTTAGSSSFQFPKQTVIFGPRQIAARINQDQVISPQITLWNQQGSEVIQGTLLVIPIEESLLYIRPLYLRAAGGRIPELKRVIVAYQNQIVMEATLDEALGRLFPRDGRGGGAGAKPVEAPGATPAAPQPAVPGDVAALSAQAREIYDRAMKAQREGNWALYGEEIKRLGEVLAQLSKR